MIGYVIAFILLAGLAYAYYRGYRVTITKP